MIPPKEQVPGAITFRYGPSDSPPDPALNSFLITGGYVLTMDDDIGDLDGGDVLVIDGVVTAIGGDLRASMPQGAVVIDAAGSVVMPGFHDGHRHSWQAQFRRMFSDHDIEGYMVACHDLLAPAYTPDDIYIGCQLTAMGAIDAGITTVLDFMHNTRSVEYAIFAARAFADAGLRCVHTFGPPSKGEWDQKWPGNIREFISQVADADLITTRLGTWGDPALNQPTKLISRELVDFARSFGVGLSADAVFGPGSSSLLIDLAQTGHLAPDIALIHCNDLTGDAWDAIASVHAGVVLCPTSDTWLGIYDATPPIKPAMERGIRPGLSIDVECSLSSDMFTVMRTVLTVQRMGAHRDAWSGGSEGAARVLTSRDLLRMATLDGATANGMGDVTGSLTPGKRADLIAVSFDEVNNMPLNEPTATVALGSDPRNIRMVMVDGVVKKWGSSLIGVDLEQLRESVYASRSRLILDSGLNERPPERSLVRTDTGAL